jgi:hypothetical protein
MLAMVVFADRAFAESLKHLQTEIQIRNANKPKVRAGSLPGHPDKQISRKTKVPPPVPELMPKGEGHCILPGGGSCDRR